jgi:hypothetical protein
MTLKWNKIDAYHLRSDCGRFSIARMHTGLTFWYVAFKLPKLEIGATQLSIMADDVARKLAVRQMQDLCEAEATARQTASEPPSESLQ